MELSSTVAEKKAVKKRKNIQISFKKRMKDMAKLLDVHFQLFRIYLNSIIHAV